MAGQGTARTICLRQGHCESDSRGPSRSFHAILRLGVLLCEGVGCGALGDARSGGVSTGDQEAARYPVLELLLRSTRHYSGRRGRICGLLRHGAVDGPAVNSMASGRHAFRCRLLSAVSLSFLSASRALQTDPCDRKRGANPAVIGHLDMCLPPRLQRRHHRLQAAAARGEAVFDLGRHLRIHLARDQAVGLQLAQLVGQHALGDVGQTAAQLIEAQRAVQQVVQHHALPLAVDQAKRGFHHAARAAIQAAMAHARHTVSFSTLCAQYVRTCSTAW